MRTFAVAVFFFFFFFFETNVVCACCEYVGIATQAAFPLRQPPPLLPVCASSDCQTYHLANAPSTPASPSPLLPLFLPFFLSFSLPGFLHRSYSLVFLQWKSLSLQPYSECKMLWIIILVVIEAAGAMRESYSRESA
mmetsp:Transcript_93932/g.195979  ORF Transcript_93932/g.195979 Transcript_93932/m.195979 type:complete len:137 (+) Transcript_93932:217-627(+)